MRAWTLASLFTVAAAGCATPGTKMVAVQTNGTSIQCAADADCGNGQLCVDRACHNVMSVSACSDLPVHFATDSAAIDTANRTELNDLAICLRENRDVRVTVAGNADERGASSHNDVLANERADAVANYLRASGVSPKQLETVAYGERDPLCRAHDASCWKQNRRADIKTFDRDNGFNDARNKKTSDDDTKGIQRIDSTGNGTNNGSPLGK
jgi:peptidoglycan-associated lipoprotein